MPAVIRPYLGVAPKIAADAFIAETAVVVGDVVIGAGSSLWYGTVVRGDVNEVRFGADTILEVDRASGLLLAVHVIRGDLQVLVIDAALDVLGAVLDFHAPLGIHG